MKKLLCVLLVVTLFITVLASIGSSKSLKSSKAAWLGLITQSVNEELADAFNLSLDYGAIVNEVISLSPADAAGIEEGDIIISYDNEKIYDSDDLIDMVEDSKPDDEVTLSIIRDGNELKIAVSLKKKPKKYLSGTFYDKYISPGVSRSLKEPKTFYFNTFDTRGDSHIGIKLSSLSEQLGEYFGVDKGTGVLISEVDEDSPAEKAGLKAGDIIIAADGEKVFDFRDVKDIIEDKEKGEIVSLTVIRNKKEKNFEIAVVERENMITEDVLSFKAPDIDFNIPKLKGLYLSDFDKNMDELYDNEELMDDIKDIVENLKELKIEFKNLEMEKNESLKKLIEEIQEELKDIKKSLD
ncbi:MAG: PDZ domain-containing protein [Candidatus Zixiibacteriota bacterium]